MALPSESLVILSPLGASGSAANSLAVINMQTAASDKCLFVVPVKMTLERFELAVPPSETDSGGVSNIALESVSAANARSTLLTIIIPASNCAGSTIYKLPSSPIILNAGTFLSVNVITEGVSNLNVVPRVIGTYCAEVEGNQSLLIASA